MQKKLIALAIAGLSSAAFAQSNVTISGQVKGGYQQYKISGSPTAADNGSANFISDETSSVVLTGSENLGNGLSAIFRIDSRFTLDQGDSASFGGGNTFVGIKSSSMGEFKMGRHDLHYNEIERIEDGAKSLSQQAMAGRGILNKVQTAAGTTTNIGIGQSRTNNVLFWDSPNWSGFTARVAYSTAPGGNEGAVASNNQDKGNAWNLVGRYENGPIKAGVSHYKQKAEAATSSTLTAIATSDQTSTRAWGAYKFGAFNVGLAYDVSKIEEDTAPATFAKRSGWAIPVSYTTGNHGVYVTYAKVGDVKTQAGKTGDSGAKQWMVGYDYSLSKRTSVGANYTKLTNDSNAAYNFGNLNGTKGTAVATNGADASQFYVGIRHAF